jgi:hypothetical protein
MRQQICTQIAGDKGLEPLLTILETGMLPITLIACIVIYNTLISHYSFKSKISA